MKTYSLSYKVKGLLRIRLSKMILNVISFCLAVYLSLPGFEVFVSYLNESNETVTELITPFVIVGLLIAAAMTILGTFVSDNIKDHFFSYYVMAVCILQLGTFGYFGYNTDYFYFFFGYVAFYLLITVIEIFFNNKAVLVQEFNFKE